jgi:predicted nucleic acid-binding protein
MIVVADSGPIHYLILLGEAGLLEKLYGVVRIPGAVALELSAPGAPAEVSDWIKNPPAWFVIESGSESCQAGDELHWGERQAIDLASAMRADLVLLDDLAARREAQRRGLRVTGTLGILAAAAERGEIDVSEVIRKLENTSFYFDEELILSVFKKWL